MIELLGLLWQQHCKVTTECVQIVASTANPQQLELEVLGRRKIGMQSSGGGGGGGGGDGPRGTLMQGGLQRLTGLWRELVGIAVNLGASFQAVS